MPSGIGTKAARVSGVVLVAAWGAGFAGSAGAQLTNPIPTGGGNLSVRLVPFANIDTNANGIPMDIVSANDGTGRMFVATRSGRILTLNSSGAVTGTFLNMGSGGANLSIFTGGEGGFPGLAFSPNFAAPSDVPGSGKFYTFTTEAYNASNAVQFSHPEIAPSGGGAVANHIVIREWSVNPANPSQALTTSRPLMRINHPQDNHQGGGLKFGPDGMLYIALGDGGGGNDRSGAATTTNDGHTNTTGNGQDTTNVLGKILRIDPNVNSGGNFQYGIPPTNPFANSATNVKEIYAYGLRNPYRISFDRGGTNQLYVGDVGQGNREEVDIVTNGGNYGWPYREGTRDNTGSNDAQRTPPGGLGSFVSTLPIGEYTHGDGNSIMGGFVYRGSALPLLYGKYVFGDYQGTSSSNSRLFYMDAGGGTIREFNYDLTGGGIGPTPSLYGFGEDPSGELYAIFATGQIVKLVPEPGTLAAMALLAPIVLRRRRD